MLKNLEGLVAIVTGSGQGIGESIARTLASAGVNVVVATRSRENGAAVVETIKNTGGDALLLQADIGSKQEVERVVSETVRHYGRLDIAIHNAAVFPMLSIEELSEAVLDSTLNINLKAAFWLTQAALPHFRKQGRGRIILTSSVTGPTVAMPLTGHYAASKAGMNGFIKTAALELAREHITVNGVEPGYIKTQAMSVLANEEELNEMASLIPMGTLGKPQDIANTMLFLASDAAAYITGQTIVVDGGSTLAESPVLLRNFYAEKARA